MAKYKRTTLEELLSNYTWAFNQFWKASDKYLVAEDSEAIDYLRDRMELARTDLTNAAGEIFKYVESFLPEQ